MLLKIKLINAIKKVAEEKNIPLKYNIKNISVNGQKRGCSGFVINTLTNSCVYVNTEQSCYSPLANKSLYRYAKDDKDYSSTNLINGNNKFCENHCLAENVVKMLIKGIGISK